NFVFGAGPPLHAPLFRVRMPPGARRLLHPASSRGFSRWIKRSRRGTSAAYGRRKISRRTDSRVLDLGCAPCRNLIFYCRGGPPGVNHTPHSWCLSLRITRSRGGTSTADGDWKFSVERTVESWTWVALLAGTLFFILGARPPGHFQPRPSGANSDWHQFQIF